MATHDSSAWSNAQAEGPQRATADDHQGLGQGKLDLLQGRRDRRGTSALTSPTIHREPDTATAGAFARLADCVQAASGAFAANTECAVRADLAVFAA